MLTKLFNSSNFNFVNLGDTQIADGQMNPVYTYGDFKIDKKTGEKFPLDTYLSEPVELCTG